MNEITAEIDLETGNLVITSQTGMGISTNVWVDSVSNNKITLKISSMKAPITGPF